MNQAQCLPAPHRRFLETALPRLSADPRIVGVAAAGSFADAAMDEFSDLDLVIACRSEDRDQVMQERHAMAAGLGDLAVAFTGEHVGEPRLLICLYGPAPLHVDLKFLALHELADRVDEPVVLWQRGEQMSEALRHGVGRWPQPSAQWVEDRFWVWVHYAATRIGRGECMEAFEFLSYLRVHVLGPLGLAAAGHRPSGVRRVERLAPELARELAGCIGRLEAAALVDALRCAVRLYLRLRPAAPPARLASRAQALALDYLDEVARRVGASSAGFSK